MVLEKIRSNAAMLVIVLAVALGAFIIGDGLRSATTWFQGSQRVAFDIDGEKMDFQEFNEECELIEKTQGQKISDVQRTSLKNNIYQNKLASVALDKISEEANIMVSNDEVYAALVGQDMPQSRQAQQFFANFNVVGKAGIDNFISEISDLSSKTEDEQKAYAPIYKQWVKLNKDVRQELLVQKVSSLLSKSYKMTDLEQKLLLAKDRTLDYVALDVAPLSYGNDDVKVSDEEVEKYYEEHKENYRTLSATAKLDVISVKIVPSAKDYAKVEEEVLELKENLLTTEDKEVAKNLLRNYSNKFTESMYLTEQELSDMQLSAAELEFMKDKAVGDVYLSGLIGDTYKVLKLQGKKRGVASIGLQIAVLDSAMATKTDSLVKVLEGNGDFASFAKEHSLDPTTAAKGGRVSFPTNQYGGMDSLFTEAKLTAMQLESLMNDKIGSIVVRNNYLIKSVDPQAEVDKYEVMFATIPVNFSKETSSEKYAQLNSILSSGESFSGMIELAKKEGLTVDTDVFVETGSPQLVSIPQSREIVRWAMEADDEAISEKVTSCSNDYFVIAQVKKHYESGFAPLEEVKKSITQELKVKKLAEQKLAELEAKKLTTLEAYAAEMGSTQENLVAVNYLVRNTGAEFNGVAMTTALEQVSKPFIAGSKVYVLKPTAEKEEDVASKKAQVQQFERGTAYSFLGRSIQNLINGFDLEDNRVRFY